MATLNQDNLEKTLNKPVAKLTQISDSLPESVQSMRETAMEKISEVSGITKETAVDYMKSAGKFVKAHPVATVAAGVGIGFLIGALLRSRD